MTKPIICEGYCGSLDWTIRAYGRVTHKHGCPRRMTPYCQTHPEGCRDYLYQRDWPLRPWDVS